ncbi:tRNA dimethylallyltransferase [Candidatus Kinetoplastibacterium desouzaii TCC079E]|uniref:tRNA dimethylallyltransferase n=1 Tax=Candidatus Kinetoplastidibacterium desouzai TCC079E TaxID=1208919 RepID=M1LSK6_9PROT|nr:tRNA (adenosine(37)-N6)-dimethylallyltransferase MiaA [Candidatus Kinetoplastibacterium desouzaii]AGF47106.1 tRNA dimethylallyltransferase [Candidatus Kinetoplastibacterium desouzaii TCC079E]
MRGQIIIYTKHRQVISLVGPTASGKSLAAMEVSKEWPIEIINMDSATIYKGMDIGTAKPSIEDQLSTKHYLLDIIDPSESYSVASFCSDTKSLLKKILNNNKIPIIVGGTMMYYKMLKENINILPPSNKILRNIINEKALNKGWLYLYDYLNKIDPYTANRISKNDKQRIQRALEVFFITGKTLSSLISEEKNESNDEKFQFVTISLEPSERSLLHKRINDRFNCMIDRGFLEEIRNLYERHDLNTNMPSMRCVGYRQLWEYLDGKSLLEEAINKSIIATRQLAKKQMTWLRAEPSRYIIDCANKDFIDKTKCHINMILNNKY